MPPHDSTPSGSVTTALDRVRISGVGSRPTVAQGVAQQHRWIPERGDICAHRTDVDAKAALVRRQLDAALTGTPGRGAVAVGPAPTATTPTPNRPRALCSRARCVIPVPTRSAAGSPLPQSNSHWPATLASHHRTAVGRGGVRRLHRRLLSRRTRRTTSRVRADGGVVRFPAAESSSCPTPSRRRCPTCCRRADQAASARHGGRSPQR